jgi:hypothetical protein
LANFAFFARFERLDFFDRFRSPESPIRLTLPRRAVRVARFV